MREPGCAILWPKSDFSNFFRQLDAETSHGIVNYLQRPQTMPSDPKLIQAVFLAAVDQPAPDRAATLDRECGANGELRRRVEALLQAHDKPGSFLESPAVGGGVTVDEPLAERPGT